MAKTIVQNLNFRTSPGNLFDLYLDPEKHEEAAGYKVTTNKKVGGKFIVHPYVHGRLLDIVSKRRIVLTWREVGWERRDQDSILILTFRRVKKGARVSMVHANVPDYRYRGISRGWYEHYWNPWRAYLKKRVK